MEKNSRQWSVSELFAIRRSSRNWCVARAGSTGRRCSPRWRYMFRTKGSMKLVELGNYTCETMRQLWTRALLLDKWSGISDWIDTMNFVVKGTLHLVSGPMHTKECTEHFVQQKRLFYEVEDVKSTKIVLIQMRKCWMVKYESPAELENDIGEQWEPLKMNFCWMLMNCFQRGGTQPFPSLVTEYVQLACSLISPTIANVVELRYESEGVET